MTDKARKLVNKINGRYSFEDLCEIMTVLRGENGCPWDREQTHKSIRKNLIEETYEVVEAIDNEDATLLREELGDLMLQIVFHSEMEKEKDSFDINDVCDEICRKLIIRHPHIFADVKAGTAGEVLKNWDAIKTETKHRNSITEQMESVAVTLPSLMRAQKLCSKADKANITVSEDQALSLCTDAIETFGKPDGNNEDNAGKLLFAVCALLRKNGIDAEEALFKENERKIEIFSESEPKLASDQSNVKDTIKAFYGLK